jgi:hypothetical protein
MYTKPIAGKAALKLGIYYAQTLKLINTKPIAGKVSSKLRPA